MFRPNWLSSQWKGQKDASTPAVVHVARNKNIYTELVQSKFCECAKWAGHHKLVNSNSISLSLPCSLSTLSIQAKVMC